MYTIGIYDDDMRYTIDRYQIQYRQNYRHSLQHLCSKTPFTVTLNLFNVLGCHKIHLMTICLPYEYQRTRLDTFFQLFSLNFNRKESNESSGFEAASDSDFLAP